MIKLGSRPKPAKMERDLLRANTEHKSELQQINFVSMNPKNSYAQISMHTLKNKK